MMTARTSYSTTQPTENEVDEWLERLLMLVAKYSNLGIDADLESLIKADAFALYLRLLRLDEEENHGD